MNIELKEREKKVLAELAKEKGMSEEAVLRMALRVYQSVENRIDKGEVSRETVYGKPTIGLCLAHEGE